jgi:hypothetical protein
MIHRLYTRLTKRRGVLEVAGRSPARTAALLMAVAIGATTFGVFTPTAASAADLGYEIKSGGYYNSGSPRIDVMWGSQSSLQGAFLWPDNSSLSQEFTLLDSGNGYYRIQARHSGQCLMLDWRGGSYTNGTKVLQYPYCSAGYAAGEWYTQWVYRQESCGGTNCFDTSHWYALIRNKATGKCLDADNPAGGLPRQQAVLQQWDCVGSPYQWNSWNQLWSFVTPTSQSGPIVR